MSDKLNKVNIHHYFFMVVIICTIAAVSCKKKGTNPEDENIVLPESNLTYTKHMMEFFAKKCASPNCHSNIEPKAGFDITTYEIFTTYQVAGRYPLVFPGDGESSILYLILISDYWIDGSTSIQCMPPNNPLNKNNTDGVKTWIDEELTY